MNENIIESIKKKKQKKILELSLISGYLFFRNGDVRGGIFNHINPILDPTSLASRLCAIILYKTITVKLRLRNWLHFVFKLFLFEDFSYRTLAQG